MIIVQGEVYLEEGHVALLRAEEEYVRKRYHAVARTLAEELIRITRKEASEIIRRSERQFQRIVKRFREEGIPGLRFKSKRPHTTPKNKTPPDIENRVVEIRRRADSARSSLPRIVNKSLSVERKKARITDTTCYRRLARNGLVKAERRLQKECKSFEWGHPGELIQSDLTSFNGYPIMTMEDDHSRKGWAKRLNGPATDDTVVYWMEQLHKKMHMKIS